MRSLMLAAALAAFPALALTDDEPPMLTVTGGGGAEMKIDSRTRFPEAAVPAIFRTDIFRNDSQTREPASREALRWTVEMGGCTGSMLSPEHMLTAHHCGPRAGAVYTSGACKVLGCSRDVQVVERLEADADLDYVILRVRLTDARVAKEQRYPAAVQVADSELVFGKDGEATKLFTVGFPVDKSMRATYAEGFAKRYSGSFMQYNIGSINGNSGGAVWTVDGRKLVGMTNHGPHAHGQPGWNNNDPENPRAWNGGPKMPTMYARSRVLKELFPDGKNPRVDACGRAR